MKKKLSSRGVARLVGEHGKKFSGQRRGNPLRKDAVTLALQWQKRYGVAPAITSAIAEYDAARLVGMRDRAYSNFMQGGTSVRRGYDFIFRGKKYQVKANRPSGRQGSRVSLVVKARNYDWDFLVWVLYDREYGMQEAWQWGVRRYVKCFANKEKLRPEDMRRGKRLF